METAIEGKLLRLPDGFDRYVLQTEPGNEVVIGLHGGPGSDHRPLAPLRRIADEGLQVVLYDQLGASTGSASTRSTCSASPGAGCSASSALWLISTGSSH